MDFIFDPSLVLYLPLYELDGSSLMSKSAYGHLGTVTGALWTPQGRSFDGTDDTINCGNSLTLDTVTALTMEAWAYTTLVPVGEDDTICRKHAAYVLSFDYGTLKAVAYIVEAVDQYKGVTGATTLSINTWYHIAATYNKANLILYLNGQQDGSAAYTGDIQVNTNNFHIGSYNGIGRFLNGKVGEARLYNRALTALEIQQNYLATRWRYN